MSQIDFSKACDFLNAADSVLITCHTRCDGDALGSAAALAGILRSRGKSAEIILPSALPARYAFLFDNPPRVISDDWRGASLAGFDAAVVLDTSVREQLIPQYDFLCSDGLPLLVIDHHLSSEPLGTVNIIDPAASSVGLLIAELARAWSVDLSLAVAEALFTAISTDTGWFRFSNTDTRTFRQACRLVSVGVQPAQLYEAVYMRDHPSRLRLLARALASLELLYDDRLACMTLLQGDFQAARADRSDAEDIVNEPMRIASVEVAVIFIEEAPDSVRISLRSKRSVDVSELARRFGGGGHSRAAAAQFAGPVSQAKKQILPAITRQLTA